MGNNFSSIEYKDQLKTLGEKDLSTSDREDINEFVSQSGNIQNVFEFISSSDIKTLKKDKPLNLIFLVHHVIDYLYTQATTVKVFSGVEFREKIRGCINFLLRFLPFVIADKTFLDVCLWKGTEEEGK